MPTDGPMEEIQWCDIHILKQIKEKLEETLDRKVKVTRLTVLPKNTHK